MKKNIVTSLFVLMMLLVTACGGGEPDERTLQDFIDDYVSAGVEVDPSEKPMFDMIGAKDGVIFYFNNSPVKIYEYNSPSDLKKSKEENTLISEWPDNGKFLLESSNEEAISIFASISK